ncbi:class I SAM-dependent methyltransferase [Bacillus sp. FJAT-27445]|uniref:class I SAM-dependent methyltransferase n=1 Tax=Bacillus sp. FJAT-27445 TaxID=1679166 RepID=UPI00074318BF|nr:class I SAM-dependent methyltransferase [Bacillus sp. FJAT-27445]
MFVTTAGRVNERMLQKAKSVAEDLDIPFIPRKKKSILQVQKEVGSGCIVAGNDSIKLFGYGESDPFFFHPSSAMFRVKRLIEGGSDPLIEAAGLKEGDSFLDCTLGLASDSIVASYFVGEGGSVTGVEGNKFLGYIVKKGLKSWQSEVDLLDAAMRRVQVVHNDALPYLKSQSDDSVDCVYFDPMFEISIDESVGINALRHFALHGGIGGEEFNEALRVARKRVVLKDHYLSPRFEAFGFKTARRKTAKFHYGYIEKS